MPSNAAPIPEDLRERYEELEQWRHSRDNEPPKRLSTMEESELIERIAALEAENAQLRAELSLWRSEHDPCPFALENEQLRLQVEALGKPVRDELAVKRMYPGAHAAPMADAAYPDYYVIRASCIEWAETLAAGATPAQAWENAAKILASRPAAAQKEP